MEESESLAEHETKLRFVLVARGLVALLFALLALASPWMPVQRLAILFALYALIDSALTFFAATRVRRPRTRGHGGLLVLEGVLSAGVAILALVFPVAHPLRILGGLRGVVIGASDLLWSRHMRTATLVEVAGVAGMGFGALLLAWPGPGVVALPWLLGLSTLVSGALLFAGAMSEFRHVELERTA